MLAAREQWAPNPFRPIAQKELREGNLPPSGTGLLLLDVRPREGWRPTMLLKEGAHVSSRPLTLGTFCSCTLTEWLPHPFQRRS